MRLRDKVEVLDGDGRTITTLRCEVSTKKSEAVYEENLSQLVLVETTTMIVKPTDYATEGRLWRWRGGEYVSPAKPVVHRKAGRDHHFTVTLERQA